MSPNGAFYDDGAIRCDEQGLSIRRYYPWGSKRIPYGSIESFSVLPLTGPQKLRRWRIWGSGDFVHWWNLDMRRPQKDTALVIDVGRHMHPTITPDDAGAVARILSDQVR